MPGLYADPLQESKGTVLFDSFFSGNGHVFFNGMALGETNQINIEDGKTLVIKYLGFGDVDKDSTRNIQFELNGQRREAAV